MKKMTKEQKRNLTWKLQDKPTAQEVADLVNAQVITPQEGREIIFGSPESDKDKIKALEDQIELLLKLVESLSHKRTEVVTVPITYERVKPYWERYWMNTSKTLSDSGFNVQSVSGTGGKAIMSVSSIRQPYQNMSIADGITTAATGTTRIN